MDNCPKCGSSDHRSHGSHGIVCQGCGFVVRDWYGRTYEERMKAREPFEPWRKRELSREVIAELKAAFERSEVRRNDAAERDRIARRLIDSAFEGQDAQQ